MKKKLFIGTNMPSTNAPVSVPANGSQLKSMTTAAPTMVAI